MTKKHKRVLYRIILSALLLIPAVVLSDYKYISLAFNFASYFVIGYDILIDAVRGIINLQPFDENFLMAIATVGAMTLGEYTEGCAVMLFYQIGELFQSYAVGKSRKSIASLMNIRPDYANLLCEDGSVERLCPEDVEIGSIIVVKPGERVAIDGVVIEGKTSLDTSALTGESKPRRADVGDEIYSASINLSGLIKVKTTKRFGESTASKILELVESASARKSVSENFISKFAKYYTPVVCFSALVIAILPPLFCLGNLGEWIYRALTFLVISCPCALVISIPLSFFACLGGASSKGILIKGSCFVETLSKVKTVVFDKTGTLTKGNFEVSNVSGEDTLYYAAHAESFSTHPIAKSIVTFFGKEIDKTKIQNIEEISGKGITADVDGKKVLVGSSRLMCDFGVNFEEYKEVGSTVYVAADDTFVGRIVISDCIKSGARDAVNSLKKLGVAKTIMLTGDSKDVAEDVASKVGIDEYFAELLPSDKVEIFESVMSGRTAFVGDGINDAPVLSRADVGIAMGGIGSDAAIEAADVVLMDDTPEKIPKAVKIAKRCMRVVYQNIVFAIAIKLLCLVLGAFGLAGMWAAIFADVGVMVLAVLNSVRLLSTKKI